MPKKMQKMSMASAPKAKGAISEAVIGRSMGINAATAAMRKTSSRKTNLFFITFL
jgi:hypothetical protein